MKKQILTTVIGLLTAYSSQACQIANRGAHDNSDCIDMIKNIYINEAKAPEPLKIDRSVLTSYRVSKNELVHDGYMTVMVDDFGDRSLCLTKIPQKNDILSIAFGEDSELSRCIWKKRATLDKEKLYSKQRSGWADAYTVKQWGNLFIAAYGSDEQVADPTKLIPDQFLVSIIDEGPLLALTAKTSLEIALDENTLIKLREYALHAFCRLTRKSPKDVVYEPLMNILKDPKSTDEMKKEAVMRLSDFNDAEANQMMLSMYNNSSTTAWLTNFILRFYPGIDREYRLAVAKSISGDKRSDNQYDAVTMAGIKNIREAAIPLIDILRRYIENQSSVDIYLVDNAIDALAIIRPERALSVLLDRTLYDNEKEFIRTDARLAVVAIQESVYLKKIPIGDIDAIHWGEDMVSKSDGSKKQVILKILKGFEQAKTINESLHKEVIQFAKSEIESGYHDYDQDILNALKNVLK